MTGLDGVRGAGVRSVLGPVVAVLLLGWLAVPASAADAPSPTPAPTTPTVRPLPTPSLPGRFVTVSVSPASGSTVGIAYPITATFSAPVTDRAAAEHHMHVYVNGVFSHGAWYWRTPRVAVFRTATFWPGHATIRLELTLAGVQVGGTSTVRYVGLWSTTRLHTLRTARALVAHVDGVTHLFSVAIDGKIVKVFTTSLGKRGYETRSGVKAVMEKYLVRHMTSRAAGITDPRDQYDLMVPYAVRITPTGEFIHGAPWALARLGRWNGSHGCTNLSVPDARWFFTTVIPGDAVVTTGTSRRMEDWNGTGAPYNIPWATWLAHSALRGQP